MRQRASMRGWTVRSASVNAAFACIDGPASTDGVAWMAESLQQRSRRQQATSGGGTSRAGTAHWSPGIAAPIVMHGCAEGQRSCTADRAARRRLVRASSRRRPSASRSTRRSTSTLARRPARKSMPGAMQRVDDEDPGLRRHGRRPGRRRAHAVAGPERALVDAANDQDVHPVERGSAVDPALGRKRHLARAHGTLPRRQRASNASSAPASR